MRGVYAPDGTAVRDRADAKGTESRCEDDGLSDSGKIDGPLLYHKRW